MTSQHPSGEQDSNIVAVAIGPSRGLTDQATRVVVSSGYSVAGPFMDAESLLARVSHGGVRAALLGERLQGFSDELVQALRAADVLPFVVTSGHAPSARAGGFGHLSLRMDVATLEEALSDFETAEAQLASLSAPLVAQPAEAVTPAAEGFIEPAPLVAVTSGKGAPGKTAVAIGLARALGSVLGSERVILADLDMRGGSVAPWLNLDPGTGLFAATRQNPNAARQAALEVEDRAWFRVLAGLDLPAESYPLEQDTAELALDLLMTNNPGSIIVADAENDSLPAWLFKRARVVVFVVAPDMVGARNAHGTAQRLIASYAPVVLAVNGTHRSSEHANEVREALALTRQRTPTGTGRPAAPVIEIPLRHDDPQRMRAGEPPGLHDRGSEHAFAELANAVTQMLAANSAAWKRDADLVEESAHTGFRARARRRFTEAHTEESRRADGLDFGDTSEADLHDTSTPDSSAASATEETAAAPAGSLPYLVGAMTGAVSARIIAPVRSRIIAPVRSRIARRRAAQSDDEPLHQLDDEPHGEPQPDAEIVEDAAGQRDPPPDPPAGTNGKAGEGTSERPMEWTADRPTTRGRKP